MKMDFCLFLRKNAYFCAVGTFEDFILAHEGDDPVRLLLSRGRFPDVDMDLAVSTIESRRKLRTKVPEWYAVPSLIYPKVLSAEQCSSSETARYKASLAARLWEGVPSGTHGHPRPCKREGPFGRGREATVQEGTPSHDEREGAGGLGIADLTGGLGVDSWAFSEVFSKVLYNEMDPALAKAAEHNFKSLGINNIEVRSCCLSPCGGEGLPVGKILGGFRPDILFLDPARRASDGRKVFLIEDCRPDVLHLLPDLFAECRFVLLKLSPMADISMVAERLSHVREVHVVSSGGECKELLLLLDREWEGGYTLIAAESGASLRFSPSEEKAASPLFPDTPESLSGYRFLYEPGKSLLKAGAFRLLSGRFGMVKAGEHTHLYLCQEVPPELKSLGKIFSIREVRLFGNRSFKETGRDYPRAEVTARNVPVTSEALRKKLGCTSGGDIHIFGLRFDFQSAPSENKLLISKVISA